MPKMMDANLQEAVYRAIPLAKAMGISVADVRDHLAVIRVPLNLNHNHHGTAFGGSLYSACTVACYALLYSLQIEAELAGLTLVISAGKIRYIRPVDRDFEVRARVNPQVWKDLVPRLKSRGVGKIELEAKITGADGTSLCSFKGDFAFVR